MNLEQEIEFNKIIKDILKNEEFINIKNEVHHGMNRLDHSLNVAKTAFKWSKILKLTNYKEITRAALLHDFFRNEELHGYSQLHHAVIANENAKKYYEISSLQSNIILSHMFPLCKTLPKYKESLLVSCADKYCAIYECTKYKVPLTAGTLMIFLINILALQR